jgi:DNA-binding CsgD family transcriptional regulator
MKTRRMVDFLRVAELANTLASMRKVGVADRGLVIRLLRGAMERFPQYLGVWCVFEHDAFDGCDSRFIGRAGHDSSGRFAPRWSRSEGALRLGRSYGHDSPTLGAWYFLTRDSRQEVVFGPYDEQLLTGLPILCLSRLAPILERDRFIGAVGVDISLDAILARGCGEPSSPESPLEATLERWHFFLHDSGTIEFASRAARRLLARHAGPCTHGRLPNHLTQWVKDLPTASDALTLADRHGGVRITALRHPHTGQRILSLEEVARPRHVAPGGTVLSAREQEVLGWVEHGKSNAEVALILGISEHTVRHHVERIFAKLGVENRRAAMLCMQQARHSSKRRFISHTPP